MGFELTIYWVHLISRRYGVVNVRASGTISWKVIHCIYEQAGGTQDSRAPRRSDGYAVTMGFSLCRVRDEKAMLH